MKRADEWEPGAIIDNIALSKNEIWDNYVKKKENSSIYHLSPWRGIIKKVFGHDAYYMCALDNQGQIAGVLPLIHLKSTLFGNFLVSMPFFNYGGCLAENSSVRNQLHERAINLAKGMSASHIEFRDISSDYAMDMAERTDKVSMRLEIPQDTGQLWSALGSKLRSQVKRSERESPTVKTGGIELLDHFYKVFSRNMRDLGTPVYGKEFFKAILETFKDQSYLIIVYKDDQPVAAGFLLGFRNMVEIPWASSLREYNKFGFNMLMYWEALKLGIEKSYTVFDFGRSTLDSGTYRFKKQWGANPVQLYWHYWLRDGGEIPMLNPTNPKYKIAIDIWKRLPLSIANSIGPKLVKNLP